LPYSWTDASANQIHYSLIGAMISANEIAITVLIM
jgi:hypothetical protein